MAKVKITRQALKKSPDKALKTAMKMIDAEIDRIEGNLDKLRGVQRLIESEKFFRATSKHFGDEILVGRATYKILDDRKLIKVGSDTRREYWASRLEEFLKGEAKSPFR